MKLSWTACLTSTSLITKYSYGEMFSFSHNPNSFWLNSKKSKNQEIKKKFKFKLIINEYSTYSVTLGGSDFFLSVTWSLFWKKKCKIIIKKHLYTKINAILYFHKEIERSSSSWCLSVILGWCRGIKCFFLKHLFVCSESFVIPFVVFPLAV